MSSRKVQQQLIFEILQWHLHSNIYQKTEIVKHSKQTKGKQTGNYFF